MSLEMSPHWKIFKWRLPSLAVASLVVFSPLALLAARGDRIEIKPKNQTTSASTISTGPNGIEVTQATFDQVVENAQNNERIVQESLDAIRERVGLSNEQNAPFRKRRATK